MFETVISMLPVVIGNDLETKRANMIPAMSSSRPISACDFFWGLQHMLCYKCRNTDVPLHLGLI